MFQMTFDAMCNMLMSITDNSLLRKIEKDCTDVSNAMLSFPFMIPGTRYYRGIKVKKKKKNVHRLHSKVQKLNKILLTWFLKYLIYTPFVSAISQRFKCFHFSTFQMDVWEQHLKLYEMLPFANFRQNCKCWEEGNGLQC